jgi:hypothetical protein
MRGFILAIKSYFEHMSCNVLSFYLVRQYSYISLSGSINSACYK